MAIQFTLMIYWVDKYRCACTIFSKVPWLDALYAVLGAILFTMVRTQTLLFYFGIVTTQYIKQKKKKNCTKSHLICSLILCQSFWPLTPNSWWGTSATPWVQRSTSSPLSAFTLTSSTSLPSFSKSLVESLSDQPLTQSQEKCYHISLVLQYNNLPIFLWIHSVLLHLLLVAFAWLHFNLPESVLVQIVFQPFLISWAVTRVNVHIQTDNKPPCMLWC